MRAKSLVACLVGMFLLLFTSSSFAAEMKTWTRKNGQTFEAEFVKLEHRSDGRNIVTLRKPDGAEMNIGIMGLSEDDRKYVRSHAKSAKGKDENETTATEPPTVPAKPAEQLPPPKSADEPNSADENPAADQSKTMTVEAKGSGKTKDEALKDAFREAVRKVVGAVVDAETLVKNDQIISDQVLTYSDGFVPKFESVSETTEDGLVHVTIRATVERRSVVAKLKAANITTKVEGENLFAEVVTSLDAEKDARDLLAKAFEGYPANVSRRVCW